MWGRDFTRNMVAEVTGLPKEIVPGRFAGDSDDIDMATTKNVKWIAKLGSQSYGNPTVADGRVYVGTNNDCPRDPRFKGDRSCVYCLDEKTGELIWQLNVPKLGTGKVSDWEFLGICSSPAIEGDRVYLVTNRCEVMCLDADGMADGNDGPFKDEGAYMPDNGKPPMEVAATDADIIWKLDMIDACGVFPHNITSCSVLIAGDRIWTATSNGVDYGHVETPAPNAPSLIVVDKHTGELLGEEASGLGSRIFHSNWSSPAYLKNDDAELAIFGGPDGWLYAFRPEAKEDEEGFQVLQEAWRYDCNPKAYRVDENGQPRKYATYKGPSEVLGTPGRPRWARLRRDRAGPRARRGARPDRLRRRDRQAGLDEPGDPAVAVDAFGHRWARVRRGLLGLRALLRCEDGRALLEARHERPHLGVDHRRRRPGVGRDRGRLPRRGAGDQGVSRERGVGA